MYPMPTMHKAWPPDLSTSEASALGRTQREGCLPGGRGSSYSENMTCAEWHCVSKRLIHSIIQQIALNTHSVFLARGDNGRQHETSLIPPWIFLFHKERRRQSSNLTRISTIQLVSKRGKMYSAMKMWELGFDVVQEVRGGSQPRTGWRWDEHKRKRAVGVTEGGHCAKQWGEGPRECRLTLR